MTKKIIFVFLFFTSFSLFAQSDLMKIDSIRANEKISTSQTILPNPIKAAAYSTLFPGLGQFYTKKYWKIPVIWGLIGVGTGFIIFNNEQRNIYKDAFIAELNGQPHQFSGKLNATSLGNAQDLHKRQMDYAIFLTALAYFLNIVDANITAHLSEFDKDVSLSPSIIQNNQTQNLGLSLIIKL